MYSDKHPNSSNQFYSKCTETSQEKLNTEYLNGYVAGTKLVLSSRLTEYQQFSCYMYALHKPSRKPIVFVKSKNFGRSIERNSSKFQISSWFQFLLNNFFLLQNFSKKPTLSLQIKDSVFNLNSQNPPRTNFVL